MPAKQKQKHGQHFLIDNDIIEDILNVVSPAINEHFFEIGSGKGAITIPIARQCKSIHALEIDLNMISFLSKRLGGKNLPASIAHGDILSANLNESLNKHPTYRLIGNLPYNISTEILFRLIDYRKKFTDAHIMVQKEVADRLVATPNSKKYGRLTLFLGLWLNFEKLFDIYPESFSPPPLVDSTFLRVEFLAKPKYKILDNLKYKILINNVFSKRRKTIANILSNVISKSELLEIDIDPMARPENISPQKFVDLSNFLSNKV